MPFTFDGSWISKPKVYGPLKVFIEKRKGGYVTIIKNLPMEKEEAVAFTSGLKKYLGVGGTIKEELIEFQGDKKDLVVKYLQEKGFKVAMGK